jgi:hypothetical protein
MSMLFKYWRSTSSYMLFMGANGVATPSATVYSTVLYTVLYSVQYSISANVPAKSNLCWSTMYKYSGWIKAPDLNRLVHVPHCISLLALDALKIGLESLLLLYEEWCGEKGKLIVLLPRTAAIYYGTCWNIVHWIYDHSMYSMVLTVAPQIS